MSCTQWTTWRRHGMKLKKPWNTRGRPGRWDSRRLQGRVHVVRCLSLFLPSLCLFSCCHRLLHPGKGSHDWPYREQHGPVSGFRGASRYRYQKSCQVSEWSSEGEHLSPSWSYLPLLSPVIPTCVLEPVPSLSVLASSKHLCQPLLETSCPFFLCCASHGSGSQARTQERTLKAVL